MKLYFRFIFRKLALSFLVVYFLFLSCGFLFEWLIQKEGDLLATLFNLLLVNFEFLVPLSVVISLVYTLSTMKANHEILALQSFGVTKTAIVTPIFLFCLLFIPLTCINNCYLLPLAKTYITEEKVANIQLPSAFLVKQLKDGSTVAYQTRDKEIFDLYWIPSFGDVWHAKSIIFNEGEIIGSWVDHIERDENGLMKKTDSYEIKKLPILITDPSDHSVTRIADARYHYTLFCYKIANALIPLLFATMLLPFFLKYSREVKPYLAYLLALICFLLFFSLLKTFIILGQNYVVAPIFSLVLLPIGLEACFLFRLCRN